MTNGQSFSVNGLRPSANNFLIDGFDNNDNGISGQAYQPNIIEAVQEVSVLSNSCPAESGRGGGSVSNLTFRSGYAQRVQSSQSGRGWVQRHAPAQPSWISPAPCVVHATWQSGSSTLLII